MPSGVVVTVLPANCRWPREMDVCAAHYVKIGGFSCGKQSVQASIPDISGYDCYSRGDGLPGVSHTGIKSLYLWCCVRKEGHLINNTNLVITVIFGESSAGGINAISDFEQIVKTLTETMQHRCWPSLCFQTRASSSSELHCELQ